MPNAVAEWAAGKYLPPQNQEAETSTLGAIFLAAPALKAVLAAGLTADDFYRERHRLIFRAIRQLNDASEPIDVLTVCERLGPDLEEAGGEAYVHSLPNLVPSAGNAGHYAGIVRDKAALRDKLALHREGMDAALNEDFDALGHVEVRLAAGDRNADARKRIAPDELAELLRDHVERGQFDAWALPFRDLTLRAAGGFHPGHVTLVGGWTSHGKSAWTSQMACDFAGQGANVRYYLTADMTAEEAGLRVVAYRTGIPFARLQVGELREIDQEPFSKALADLPFAFVEAYDATGDDIFHEIRRDPCDFAVVDIFHELPYDGERDLRRLSRLMNSTARSTGTHIIATVHLNDERAKEDKLPLPVRRDVKGASALGQAANNVMFVWRENTPLSIGKHGRIYFNKVRGGVPGGIDVTFEGARMKFTEGRLDD